MADSGYLSFSKFRPGGQGMVFLLCFLIAGVIWTVNALSKSYSTTYSFNVITKAAPENKGEKIKVYLRGSGFSLMRLYYRMNNAVIEKYTTHQLSTQELADSITGDLRGTIQVIKTDPSMISGILTEGYSSKKVPVKGKVSVTFAGQYGSIIPVMYQPDSIEISGPSKMIDTIRYIETVPLKIKDLDKRLFRSITLESPHAEVMLSRGAVWMYVMAERFTEQKTEVPVIAGNRKYRALPERITLTCNVPLSRFEDVKASKFRVEVNTAVQLENGKYPLKVTAKPFYAKNIALEPEVVSLLMFE